MSDSESHEAGEPHNGRCAFGADCGHATIIDKADLASLRAALATSQADVTRLAAELAESVRALAVSQGEVERLRDDIHDERDIAVALLTHWVRCAHTGDFSDDPVERAETFLASLADKDKPATCGGTGGDVGA